jgi:DNA-binding NtrC family response regulator
MRQSVTSVRRSARGVVGRAKAAAPPEGRYVRAFEKWQRDYLTRQLEHARGSVSHMAAYLGLNRQNAYVLLRRVGIRPKTRKFQPIREGNAAWRSLSDESRV